MSLAESVVQRIEEVGGTLAVNGERIRVRLPDNAVYLIEELRVNKEEVLSLLRIRDQIPAMPPGVRLVRWEPKPPPVVLTYYAVVTDVSRFISMTLLELDAALAGKQWRAGHRSVRELVDRLEQCGVTLQVSDLRVRTI